MAQITTTYDNMIVWYEREREKETMYVLASLTIIIGLIRLTTLHRNNAATKGPEVQALYVLFIKKKTNL